MRVDLRDRTAARTGRPTDVSRRQRHPRDAAAAVTVAAALAMLIPGHLVIPGLTGIGRPAMVFGVVLSLAWLLSRLHPDLAAHGPQPQRWAAAAYLTAMLLAYVAGQLRGLPTLEANAADRAMVMSLVFVGVALMCADGVATRSRLDHLLWLLLGLGAVVALIGHVQFAFEYNPVELIRIPGLVDQRDAVQFRARGAGFFQVASTTMHYIEFSTVMAMLVPIGIHAARFGRTRLGRQAGFAGTVVMAAAIPITLSRTGMVGVVVGLLVLAWFWPWRTRYSVAMLAVAMLAALVVVRPGLLGTVRAIFVHAGDDPSIHGRTETYAPAFGYIQQRPLFGRGPGTFMPELYQFVDNDWLIHMITVGVVGTAAYAAWHLTAMALAIVAYRRSIRDADRHLCGCLLACQVTAVVVAAFFDAMAFTTHTMVLSILTGAAGAMWRFTRPSRQLTPPVRPGSSRHP
jgi:polysaccharide biosynthesis protein PslJ